MSETGIDPLFISIKETAEALGVTTWTVTYLLDNQKIASHYIGRRRLVSVESLREYAATLPIYPTGPLK